MSASLARWDPLTDLEHLRASMDRMFDRRIGSRVRPVDGRERPFVPGVDVEDREEGLVITAAIPGVRPEDVEVTTEDGVLTIKAETKREHGQEDAKFLRRELHYGAYERAVRVPASVDVDRASATVANGMLTVTLPHRAEARPRTIEVKSGEKPAIQGEATS